MRQIEWPKMAHPNHSRQLKFLLRKWKHSKHSILKNSTNKAWKNRINTEYLKDNIHHLPRNYQTTIFRSRTDHCHLNAHMHRLKIGSTPLWLRTQPTDSRTCADELPTYWATEEKHMAYRNHTRGETMGNKGGTTVHSFLHQRNKHQSLGFRHEENDHRRGSRRLSIHKLKEITIVLLEHFNHYIISSS